jgi:hypothetical protein
LPSYPETYPDMIVTLIFLLLDFSLTCIATFLWIDPKSLSPGLIIVPLVSGALAGTLIGFQMELMVRVRAMSRRVIVVSVTKAKDDIEQDNLWDTDHDGYPRRTS